MRLTHLPIVTVAACLVASIGPLPPHAAAAPVCTATAEAGQPRPLQAGVPCLIDITPYPFGRDGQPVDPTSQLYRDERCQPSTCFLEVTSLAFRSYNRGLAATRSIGNATSPFAVWLFNGSRWFPDPTFLGRSRCSGSTVIWAGKRDYWLLGGTVQRSGALPLCRFDGVTFEWSGVPLPTATWVRLALAGATAGNPGRIRAGACSAWNDCWFFGDYGTRLRWDGLRMVDASPDLTLQWLTAAVSDAVIRRDAAGNSFGVAVTRARARDVRSTSERIPPLPSPPDGSPLPQLYAFGGVGWSPAPLDVPAAPRTDEPARSDVTAVDLDASGRGWALVHPMFEGGARRKQPAALVPVTPAGGDGDCDTSRFPRWLGTTDRPVDDATHELTDVSIVPGDGTAFVTGAFTRSESARPPWVAQVPIPAFDLPAPLWDPGDLASGQEPVLILARCGAEPQVIRPRTTRLPVPSVVCPPGETCPERSVATTGAFSAVAANAVNDAWVAAPASGLPITGTLSGVLVLRSVEARPNSVWRARFDFTQAWPRLYRYTDGTPPQAPRGDDAEVRDGQLIDDPTPFVEPPQPSRPPLASVRPKRKVVLPAIYGVVTKLRRERGEYRLSVTFSLRRRIKIGLVARRRKTVVVRTTMHGFNRGKHQLRIELDPKRWPTRIGFATGPGNG